MKVHAKFILKSVRDVRAAARFGFAMCDRNFAHFLEQKGQKNATSCLKNYSRTSYPVLEHPFLL